MQRRARIARGLAGFLCVASVCAGIALRDIGEWNVAVFAVLVAFSLIGDRLEVETKMSRMSPSFRRSAWR